MTIVKNAAGYLFAVRETNNPDLAHVWHAIPMKRVKGGYAVRGSGVVRLIRKAGCVEVRAKRLAGNA